MWSAIRTRLRQLNEPVIQGRQIRAFGAHSGMGELRQAGPQGAIARASLARALFASALIGTRCHAGLG
jgi:hypothetical protein